MDGRLKSRALVDSLHKVREWSGRTETGDIAEVTQVSEDSPIWPMVTSTADNCLGQECPSFRDCHVMNARRKAQEADVLVINHHLLFADMALKEEGFGELLPGANAFILDEAHTLPEIATSFFGVSMSSRQLQELARDTRTEHIREAGDMAGLPDACDKLEKALQDFRILLGKYPTRLSWKPLQNRKDIQQGLEEIRERLDQLSVWLEHAAQRGKGLDNCWRRCMEFQTRLKLITRETTDEHIQWLDVYRQSFTFNLTPLEVAEGFHARMQEQNCAWIFTSATLAVGDSFNHFSTRLGIEDARTVRLDSPFDYPNTSLLTVPASMPDPNSDQYTNAVIDAALPLIDASGGRTFLLFTSHRALRQAQERLEDEIDFPLLVQGDAPRGILLEKFREYGNAVLLGTNSFWEGVDVRGPALSCVIIDKLPFASPGDPVLQARIDLIRKRGGNPFMDYQLPNAVIQLKQGVGRLIRDVNDRGVMMLCDPRLLNKPYGKIFLKSLPPMRRTRDLNEVISFLQQH
jgi:ATP-dependent DNA helicase DinG